MRRGGALLLLFALAACTRSNMDSQPKYHEYEPGGLFRDGKVLQAPVPTAQSIGRPCPMDGGAELIRLTKS